MTFAFSDTLLADLKHHPRVCSNCYRFLKDEDPLPTLLAERRDAATAVWTAVRPHVERDAPPGEVVAERTPRWVCECGVVSPFAVMHRDEHLTTDQLVAFTGNLTETCDSLRDEATDRGNERRADRFEHDADVLYRCVRHLKRQPEHQRKDDLILAASLEVARNHA